MSTITIAQHIYHNTSTSLPQHLYHNMSTTKRLPQHPCYNMSTTTIAHFYHNTTTTLTKLLYHNMSATKRSPNRLYHNCSTVCETSSKTVPHFEVARKWLLFVKRWTGYISFTFFSKSFFHNLFSSVYMSRNSTDLAVVVKTTLPYKSEEHVLHKKVSNWEH